ncbi:cellulose binding domain-containing protein [Abyssalbus ytuae]|uniref:T9SS type A sorting domain-containing protein n=1 Tax=Abyssalbus ytuae TaxID=2926907 RepID=A0A9E6ZL68_9FLAO|nr:cellulose binding domain-containing protein [Abyssalbus ytuae]UOB17804.1 T9SS type A sorting domain-containing protein [Abyssalbus ytuae]
MKQRMLYFFMVLFLTIRAGATIYNCSTVEEITYALNNVQPGDEIIIQPGTYISSAGVNGAYFYSNIDGTAANPITIRSASSTNRAQLQGDNIAQRIVLRIFGDYWIVKDLDISNGLKGLVFDNSNYSKAINCDIHTTGNEAVHVRDGADYVTIESCKIYNTGNENSGAYGEGIYIGTDKGSWSSYDPYCNYTTVSNCEIGPNVRAEGIDLKEGTLGTIIEYNIFNAEGLSGANYSDSFIDLKGARSYIRYNTFNGNDVPNLLRGIAAIDREVAYSSYEHAIHDNIFNINDTSIKLVEAYAGTTEVYAWDNTRIPDGDMYNSRVLESIPGWYNSSANYVDQFDDSTVTLYGSALTNLEVSESGCEELKLEMKAGATLPAFTPILYGFPEPLDFSGNPTIRVRVRSANSFNLRFDLHDGTNATNGVNGRVTQTIPAGLDDWTELEFNYSDLAFTDNGVNKSAITRINIQLDPGNENFPGPLYIDYIAIGTTPTTTDNAVCKTDDIVAPNQKYIILKMDDLRSNSNNTYNANWQRFVDSIRVYNVKAALGLIAKDLVSASQSFKDSLSKWHNEAHFEIWHHGWDHKKNNYPPDNDNIGEFSGTPYDYQKQHFEDAMLYAKNELGIIMRSFGAPYNQTDDTFLSVIEENDDIKVWMYPTSTSYSGLALLRGANNQLESSTGVVSYESFLNAYNSSTADYLVLQAHPGYWNDSSFEQFDQVITFLKNNNVVFVLPYEYYGIVNGENEEDINYVDQFDDSTVTLYGSALTNLEVSESGCEELKLEMKAGATLPAFTPILYGFPEPLDFSGNPTIRVRVRSANSFNLRFDLHDGTNATNGVNGRVTQTIPAGLDDWTELEFNYSDLAFTDNGVNKSAITRINIQLDPGNENFPGPLYIDYIAIGTTPSTTDNAVCKTDEAIDVMNDLRLQYYCAETIDNNSKMKPYIRIVNNDSVAVPFKDLKVRYWFTKDISSELKYKFENIEIGNEIYGEFHELDPVLDKADHFIDITFDDFSGELLPNEISEKIKLKITNANNESFNELNDYSFNPDILTFSDFDKITLYQNGILIWGEEPSEIKSTSLIKNNNIRVNLNEEDIENKNLIYPNPTPGILYLKVNDKWLNGEATIFNLYGRRILKKKITDAKHFSLDLSVLQKGNYVLLLNKGKDSLSKLIIKK